MLIPLWEGVKGLPTVFCLTRATRYFKLQISFSCEWTSWVICRSQHLQGTAVILKESASCLLLILACKSTKVTVSFPACHPLHIWVRSESPSLGLRLGTWELGKRHVCGPELSSHWTFLFPLPKTPFSTMVLSLQTPARCLDCEGLGVLSSVVQLERHSCSISVLFHLFLRSWGQGIQVETSWSDCQHLEKLLKAVYRKEVVELIEYRIRKRLRNDSSHFLLQSWRIWDSKELIQGHTIGLVSRGPAFLWKRRLSECGRNECVFVTSRLPRSQKHLIVFVCVRSVPLLFLQFPFYF